MNVCLLQVAKEAVIGLSNKLSIDLILVIVLYWNAANRISKTAGMPSISLFSLFTTATVAQFIFTSSMHSTQITICVACSSNIRSQTHTKNNERIQSKWFEIKTRLKCFEIWIWFQLFFSSVRIAYVKSFLLSVVFPRVATVFVILIVTIFYGTSFECATQCSLIIVL